MELNQYQREARATAIYSKAIPDPIHDLTYTILGLVGEAGEVAQVMKKFLRDGGPALEMRAKMLSEIGDVLWYIAMLADELGLELDVVARSNLTKLKDRQTRGTIGGSGDER